MTLLRLVVYVPLLCERGPEVALAADASSGADECIIGSSLRGVYGLSLHPSAYGDTVESHRKRLGREQVGDPDCEVPRHMMDQTMVYNDR